jgi:hypothetical protein
MKSKIIIYCTSVLLVLNACKKDELNNSASGSRLSGKCIHDNDETNNSAFGSGLSGKRVQDAAETGFIPKTNTRGLAVGQHGPATSLPFKLRPSEWNCSFESHLKKVIPKTNPAYFIADVEGMEDSFNVFLQFTVNINNGFQYGRTGCFDVKEAWNYYINDPKGLYKIYIDFINSKKLPNLEFMTVGDYYYQPQNSGYVRIRMIYNGKTYSTDFADNKAANGQFLRITGYNSLIKNVPSERFIAFQFNANLKAGDGSQIKLLNAVYRSSTIEDY